MVEVNRAGNLGAWSADELVATARENSGVGADAGLEPGIRFASGVAKLVRTRVARPEFQGDPTGHAVFLLSSPVPGTAREPMLDDGTTALTGRIWFVNPAVVDGAYLSLPPCGDAQLFATITGTLGLGACPAIVFKPAAMNVRQTIRVYPHGVAKAEDVRVVTLGVRLKLADVYETIDGVHEQCLITPTVHARAIKLWAKPASRWVAKNAEDCILAQLKPSLVGRFPTCTIRSEVSGATGRYDLGIEERNPLDRSKVTRHAVLELKVLRSYGESGKAVSGATTRAWVEAGVRQGAAYRDEKGARLAALCCFDMRGDNSGSACFKPVKNLAKRLRVELGRWFLYASSAELRMAMTSGAHPSTAR